MKVHKNRDSNIDITKGIGILLVIWGHSSSFLFDEIYAFHMPLFFFLSGCFFSSSHLSTIDFLKKKSKQLLIPYVIFYLLSCLYYWTLLILTNRFSLNDLWSLKGLLPFNNEIVNAPLWFFYALFWMSIIYFMLRKYIKRDNAILFVAICFHLIEYVLSKYGIELPFYLGRALRELIYLHLGYIFYNKLHLIEQIRQNPNSKNLFYILASLLLFYGLFRLQIFCRENISYSLISIITAIGGIFSCLLLSHFIDKCWIKRLFIYLGTHTLCLFAIHLPLYEISRPIAKLFFDKGSIWYDSISFGAVLLLSIIGGEILMLIFPKYLGNSSLIKLSNLLYK